MSMNSVDRSFEIHPRTLENGVLKKSGVFTKNVEKKLLIGFTCVITACSGGGSGSGDSSTADGNTQRALTTPLVWDHEDGKWDETIWQ